MADPTPLSDDELVSAYIDGELTDDERARVEADPRLMAILHELTPVVTAVRTPVDLPDPDMMDSLISRALDRGASTAAARDDAPTEPIAPVLDLAQRRARRNQILTRAGAVAAGIAVVALAGVTIQSMGGSDSDNRGSAAEDSRSEDFASHDAGADEGDDATGEIDAEAITGSVSSDDAADSAVAAADENAGDEDAAEAPSAEDAEGLFPNAPPSVPGLATDLGPTDQAALEALVDDNLALLSGTPPVEPRPRCSNAGFVASGFEVVWWAEAEWEGAPAHVVAWRSSTELLVTVYEGSGTVPDVFEECEALLTFAR